MAESGSYEETLKGLMAKINTVLGPFAASISELIKLFPDSLLFGSFFLYVLTQNLSYGVFSLFMFETSLLHSMTEFVVQQTVGDTNRTAAPGPSCVSGFVNPRLGMERLRSVRPHALSPFAFYSGAVLVYLCAAISQFKESLDTMGPDWSGRY